MKTRKTRNDILEQLSPEELYRRALDRSLYILEHSDKTEAELRRKLRTSSYPDDVADRVVAYLKDYGYVDDRNYALNYVRSHSASLSRRAVSDKLYQKGLSKDCIDEAFASFAEEESELKARSFGSGTDEPYEGLSIEETAAVNTLRRKLAGRTALDEATRAKVTAFMYRKGFGRDAVRTAFEVLEVGYDDDIYPE